MFQVDREDLDAGDLELHGWVYDFVRGEVHVADASGAFAPLAAAAAGEAA